MKYLKFIAAILLSITNVLLSSRTLDSILNPMTFLGLFLYAFNVNEFICICAYYFWMSTITFALFAVLVTKRTINKATITYVILMTIPFVYLSYHKQWILSLCSEVIISRIDSFCGYSGTSSLLIHLLFQIIHIIIITFIFIWLQRKRSDKCSIQYQN